MNDEGALRTRYCVGCRTTACPRRTDEVRSIGFRLLDLGHQFAKNAAFGHAAANLALAVHAGVAGGTPSTGEPSFWADGDTGIPWVAIGDMSNRDFVSKTAKSLTAAGLADKRLSPLPAGSVLYSMYASVGFAAILEVPAVTNQAILGLAHDREVEPRYGNTVFHDYDLVMTQAKVGASNIEAACCVGSVLQPSAWQ